MSGDTDGSGSDCSWSVVTSEGDLVDSDAFSLSEHDQSLAEDYSGVESDDGEMDTVSEAELDEDRAVESEGQQAVDEPDDQVSVVDESEALEESTGRYFADPALAVKCLDKLACENQMCAGFAVERQVQVLAFAVLISTIFLGLVFGNIVGVEQCLDSIDVNQQNHFSVFEEKERLYSWLDDSEDLMAEAEKSDVELQLLSCRNDYEEAMKVVQLKAALVRYMRLRNRGLADLVSQLRSETEATSEQTPLQSESPAPSVPGLCQPCQQASPKPSQSLLADDISASCDKLQTPIPCEPVHLSLLNATRSLIQTVVTFANSTAVGLPITKDLVRIRRMSKELSSWIGNKALTSVPRAIERVKTHWRAAVQKYVRKIGQLVETRFKPLPVCQQPTNTCPLTEKLVSFFNASDSFKSLVAPKEVRSYVSFLKQVPPKQCFLNSTMLGCERCWWTGSCVVTKKRCNLRRWQRQKRVQPTQFVAENPALQKVFKEIGWNDTNKVILRPAMTPALIRPPRSALSLANPNAAKPNRSLEMPQCNRKERRIKDKAQSNTPRRLQKPPGQHKQPKRRHAGRVQNLH